jgi:hypothetical protein
MKLHWALITVMVQPSSSSGAAVSGPPLVCVTAILWTVRFPVSETTLTGIVERGGGRRLAAARAEVGPGDDSAEDQGA